MLPASNDPKKEKLKDVLLGLHWAATTGNVGKESYFTLLVKSKTHIYPGYFFCRLDKVRSRSWRTY